jgi:hypothetical protein
MPPLNPEELLEQASRLAEQSTQADLRRAISSAYYGLFNFFQTAAADMIVGPDKRDTPYYGLVYRSIDHNQLRALSNRLSKSKPDNQPMAPAGGSGKIADVARLAGNLLERRSKADYDPYIHAKLMSPVKLFTRRSRRSTCSRRAPPINSKLF